MDRIDFSGQVAVVTGAGGALGSAFCRELAKRGAAIVANDLGGSTTGEGGSTDYADAIVRELRAGAEGRSRTMTASPRPPADRRSSMRRSNISAGSTSSSATPATSATRRSAR
ncbi:hypothetical protein ACFSTI_25850 [Rhizorhabdus histidinilytica]